MLANVSAPLLGLLTTAVVGHLASAHALGAVTLGGILFGGLCWSFGFLRMGTTGVTAQAHGRQDDQAVRDLLSQSLAVALGLGALLLALAPWLIAFGVRLLGGDAETRALATSYAQIRSVSAPAVLANYVVIGWLLGQQHARATLHLTLLSNALTLVGTLLLVLGLARPSDGVAWAAVCAEYTVLGLAARMVRHHGATLAGRFDRAALQHLGAYAALFRVNRHLFVRTLCLLGATAFFTARGAAAGPTVLAANAVLMQGVLVIAFVLDGFAQAAEALTGRAVGAHRFAEFGAAVRACLRWALLTAVAAALLVAGGGPWIIALLTTLDEVRATARHALPWLVAMPLLAVWGYLLDGVFIGATQTKAMRDTLLLALAAYLLAWYVTQGYGNHGLWFAYSLFMGVRSASLGAVYLHRRRGVWRDRA